MKRERPDEAPYVVRVLELPVKRTFEVPGTTVDDWLRGMPMRDALGAPNPDPDAGHGKAEVDLYADGTHVFLAGTFVGHLTVACGRCVGPVRLDLAETLRVTFMPAHELPAEEDDDGKDKKKAKKGAAEAEDEGPEVAADDLDVFPFDGERVDLEPLLREQFVLAVPYAPLCREDCKGLCPQCGIDRNTGTCSCQKPIDPRFAGLAALDLKKPS